MEAAEEARETAQQAAQAAAAEPGQMDQDLYDDNV